MPLLRPERTHACRLAPRPAPPSPPAPRSALRGVRSLWSGFPPPFPGRPLGGRRVENCRCLTVRGTALLLQHTTSLHASTPLQHARPLAHARRTTPVNTHPCPDTGGHPTHAHTCEHHVPRQELAVAPHNEGAAAVHKAVPARGGAAGRRGGQVRPKACAACCTCCRCCARPQPFLPAGRHLPLPRPRAHLWPDTLMDATWRRRKSNSTSGRHSGATSPALAASTCSGTSKPRSWGEGWQAGRRRQAPGHKPGRPISGHMHDGSNSSYAWPTTT